MSGDADTPAPTEAERALAEVAASRFTRYQNVFAPLENEYIREVFALRSPGSFQEARGQASTAVEREFGAAERDLDRRAFSAGIDPSSGAYQGGSRALMRAKERALGLGGAGAQIDQADRAYQGMQNVIAMGNNQAFDAMEGMGDVAARANDNAARSAQTAFNRATTGMEVAGTAAGVAAGYGVNRNGT